MIAISALSFERHMLPRMLASPFSLKTLLILALNIIGVLSVSFYGLVFSKLFSLFSFFCRVFFAIISILIACVCVYIKHFAYPINSEYRERKGVKG
jgi:predicted membrane protein